MIGSEENAPICVGGPGCYHEDDSSPTSALHNIAAAGVARGDVGHYEDEGRTARAVIGLF